MAESWTPTLEQVADHIPTRTRPTEPPGTDTLLGTFNGQTTPTAEQANRQITAAVAEVLAAVGGTIPAAPPHLATLASEAAALRAAASIELAYPDRQADVNVYEQLNARAIAALQRLIDAVNDAGSGPEGALMPVWAFPDPPRHGDYPL
ncbi:hypothetical protein [Nonomuraea roseoviolacea]|uniref:PE domain-containing protein n=1 Tax=Nonomuraea roseoviolacea subsp. carminata TaxID=160689 RepID=A0ABT1KAI2_9ACTN|nr:hypothetical protein [Nonomuraea roseoviolacea]MCP2350619.1 hypothetical protein [Nonomuraea roseoviolacea subsp. carminata]